MAGIICVIPARYGSTRLPGKPLCLIDGLPLVMWVYRNAKAVGVFDEIYVATDDHRIYDAVLEYEGTPVMTSPNHSRGTDRIAEAVDGLEFTHVVNLQGDEPDIPVSVIRDFADGLSVIDHNSLLTIVSHATIKERDNPHVVKAVVSYEMDALYFSRAPIPFDRDTGKEGFLRHIGIYGFTRESFQKFCMLPQGILERRESLEQLRALEHGMRIKCIVRDFESHGIDTYEDLQAFRENVSSGRYKQK